MVRFHGLFVPNATHRPALAALAALVPKPIEPTHQATGPTPDEHADDDHADDCGEKTNARPVYRRTWAQLLARVFKIDVLVCPRCTGPVRIIAAITAPEPAAKILDHLKLPHDTYPPAPARAPPEPEFEFQY